ncbi:hypothetical protein [Bradyrhizobium sp. STM 3809]|uniref:hypothetical protein n=1 Tax=Bradyrhizobium sp. STM 3809 TaxID=551936 RepID=UPI00024093AC|nr:hypothetical protein [Bradyrhizobium sp. STM 3809]CCE01594.1 conserved hypothetical protein [Bradyrhizobium sp. STM 3809]
MVVDPARTASDFDLLGQPFRFLRITPSATKRAMEDAVQVIREASAAVPQELLTAHQALSDLKTRLFHELTYPLACSPGDVEAFYLALDNGVSTKEALSFVQRLSPLDRANFLAHVANRRPAPGELLIDLISAQAAIDTNEVYAAIKAARQSAELPPPSLVSVSDGISRACDVQLTAALRGYPTVWEAIPAVLDCTIHILSTGASDCWSRLDLLLDKYEAAIDQPRLEAKGFIEQVCALLREQPNHRALHERLRDSVHLWTSLCRPVLARQLTYRPDGDLDTPLGTIRDLLEELAQTGAAKAALAISDATREIFAAVPTTMDQLSADARLLSRLTLAAQLEELNSAIEGAKADSPAIINALESSGFGEQSVGQARVLWLAFTQASKTADTTSRELAWKQIHQFTLRLSNAPGAGKAVIALISGLIVYGEANAPPPTLMREMRNSLQFMQSFVGAAPHENNHKPVATPTPPSPRPSLFSGLRRMTSKRKAVSRGNLKRRLWRLLMLGIGGLIAITLGGIAINLSLNWFRSSSKSVAMPATAADDAPPLALAQTIPPVGTGQRLDVPAVRYCHFQKERLRFIKQSIKTPEQARHLNLLVVDYNSRCSDFFYRDDDLRQVQAEVDANAPSLAQEAKQIIAGWQ